MTTTNSRAQTILVSTDSCASSTNKPAQLLSALSGPEAAALANVELLIGEGLTTFFEVGTALLAIRDGRLYRDRFETFQAYCNERWGFGRNYAWRVIGAAERLNLLPPSEDRKPTSEFQMRPFLKLEPEEFPKAWRSILDRAEGGRVTSKLIGSFMSDYHERGKMAKRSKPQPKRVVISNTVAAEILIQLHTVRRRIEAGQGETTIPSLERIEQLLFER